MAEVKTMQTKKNKVYDSFVDKTARTAAAGAMEKANEVESSLDEFKEEVEAVAGEMQTQIHDKVDLFVDEIAKKEQLKPEYANDISECTDTSKLYVLPDGYIYAYVKTPIQHYVNAITDSVEADGETPYNNGLGYKKGYRLVPTSNGTEGEAENANTACTGFIKVNKGDIVYLKNLQYKPGQDGVRQAVLGMYDANCALIAATVSASFSEISYLVGRNTCTTDGDGNLTSFDITDTHNNGVAYIRFSAVNLNSSTIISINDPIVEATEWDYAWTNTRRQFVPGNSEERIIPLEKTTEEHEKRIKTLEMYGADSTSPTEMPVHVKAEADGVMDRLMEKQGNRCFTMVAMSDFHYSNYAAEYNDPEDDPNRKNLIRASQAAAYISERMHIDAVATLGDILPFGDTNASVNKYMHRWLRDINEILCLTQRTGVVDFRAVGNHDRAGGNDASGNPTPFISDSIIYSYIGGYNRQCDYVDVCGGWAYRDFVGYKLRVIVLNTAECEGKARFSIHSGYHLGNKQYNWLVRTLDLSEKEDASEWQILILSHHRADDGQVRADGAPDGGNAYILPNILNAYKKGGSYSGVVAEEGISVSCNFAGKNQAKLIGQIHGHHHNYKFSDLYLGLASNSTQTDIMAIGTPTTSFVAGGHNADNEGNIYKSVKDTAEETAFCVYSIDLDNHKIHAIHYGAGVDREIDY